MVLNDDGQIVPESDNLAVESAEVEDAERLTKLFIESSMDSFDVKIGRMHLHMTKPIGAAGTDQAALPNSPSIHITESPDEIVVKAPLVGVFYAAPSPTDDPFIQEGQCVAKGQTLCIIEAMKVMNEILAPCDATVVSVTATDGEVVAFDDALMTLKA